MTTNGTSTLRAAPDNIPLDGKVEVTEGQDKIFFLISVVAGVALFGVGNCFLSVIGVNFAMSGCMLLYDSICPKLSFLPKMSKNFFIERMKQRGVELDYQEKITFGIIFGSIGLFLVAFAVNEAAVFFLMCFAGGFVVNSIHRIIEMVKGKEKIRSFACPLISLAGCAAFSISPLAIGARAILCASPLIVGIAFSAFVAFGLYVGSRKSEKAPLPS